MNNDTCKAHSGFKSDITTLQRNVKELWDKWNWMQRMIVAAFAALALNLVGVVVLLLRQ